MKRLIGLTGKAGSGKDTVADYLKLRHEYMKVAFATPLKNGIKAMLDLTDVDLDHPKKEQVIDDIGKSPRQMMQTLGTEWGRNCVNTDLWLILAKRKIDLYHGAGYDVVITDCRFENEAKFIRDNGGTVVHILRDGAGTPHAHASEAGVSAEYNDYVLSNNGPIASLYEQVEVMLKARA